MSDGRKRYLILAWRKEGFDAAVIAPHHAHLDALRDQGRLELAGPFSDRSGGAYVVRADDLAQAESIASTPLVIPEQMSGGTTRRTVRKKKEEE